MDVPDLYGIIALLIVILTLAVWFQKVKAVRLTRVRFHYFSAWIIGALLGVYAITTGAGWIGTVPAVLAIALGFGFPLFRLGSNQGDHKPAVSVGDQIIDFTLPDDAGNAFSLASLKGKPFLLKFFRGHW